MMKITIRKKKSHEKLKGKMDKIEMKLRSIVLSCWNNNYNFLSLPLKKQNFSPKKKNINKRKGQREN